MSLSGTQNIQKQRSFQQLRFNPQRMSRTGFPLKALFALRSPGFWEWRIWGYTGHRHGKSQEHAKVRTETAGEEHSFPETRDSEGLPSHHHTLWLADVCSRAEFPRTRKWSCHPEKTHIGETQTYNHLRCSPGHKDYNMRPRSGIGKWEKMAGTEITLLIILGLLQSLQPLP